MPRGGPRPVVWETTRQIIIKNNVSEENRGKSGVLGRAITIFDRLDPPVNMPNTLYVN